MVKISMKRKVVLKVTHPFKLGPNYLVADIYRLHKEVDILAAVGSEGTNDIRVLASELEKALESLLAKTNSQERKGPDSEPIEFDNPLNCGSNM